MRHRLLYFMELLLQSLQQVAGFTVTFLSTGKIYATTRAGASDSAAENTCSSNKPSATKKKTKKLYSFDEARKIARGHGFSNKQEFLDYECPGAYQLPKNPQEIWAAEWQGWDDWLGIPYEFEESKRLVRQLGLKTQEEYEAIFQKARKENLNDHGDIGRLPFRPDLYYRKDWSGWDEFLSAYETT